MSSGGFRASIPGGVRKTIQNIKEITGNHSEEEVYAMLKECSMDPNETAQKLLFQDTFHEVKRKKDRKKENLNNRESAESRWRPGNQGRGGRGSRVNISPHQISHDAGGGKHSGTRKDIGNSQLADKVTPLPNSQETKDNERNSGSSSVPIISNGPATAVSGTTSVVHASQSSTGVGDGMSSSSVSVNSLVLLPSSELRFTGVVGTIKREVGSQRPPGEPHPVNPAESKSTAASSEIVSSSVQVKIPSKPQGVAKNQLTDLSQSPSTITHGNSSVSRPSSNYNNRSQQIIGTQKVGSNKEWKPKPTSTVIQGSGSASASEFPAVSAEATAQESISSVLTSEATSKPQRKLEELRLPQRQHVILPNHIYVPESEKTKFCFGSLGATFGVSTSYVNGPESEKSSTPPSETSQGIEETVEEQAASNQNDLVTPEVGDYPDHPQSPTHVPENLSSGEVDVSSSAIQEYHESKQESAFPSGGHQYSVVHTSPNYSFGLVPPMLGTQLAPFENSESQARDVSRLPSYVVHQPFDPASYYAQFYRSAADSDGRLSPFPSTGVTTKYNGNVAVLPAPNSQSPQEGGVLSTAGPTPLVTQAAGLMQSSIAVTQQPVPVFRPPAGVHISHYPPNYIPYAHYFSPFYVPPPAIHQFMGNGTFPQQHQANTVYPPPPPAAATGVKYPLPQYKPGSNAGNPAHILMPNVYGAYGSSPAGYNPSSAATSGNSTSNEDLGASSQFKENVYISGQQSEGSAVWVAAPGRDISSLPTSSFYNLPPQSQHVTFTPTQAGHGTFAGVYHPAQAVTAATVHPLLQQSQGAVDMVGPGGSIYQQPQHAQMNWPSNY
ncbi:GBF-interacting protein 1-like isoform X2 [Quillaja saponaria]|uniref:GBF-interacting protein 1-like isoform X2 n=1 Tax=Quillaja saponaria TaxID=32244 RepID=A0AAD7LUR1_QUISA|nr:GBF-interacting protein 1-like isoform X2 [Quillaja saponaria]